VFSHFITTTLNTEVQQC